MAATPSLAELRRLAEAQGVAPSDEDLEAVSAFLTVLLPAFEELEQVVPPATPPAALFLPGEAR
jgi:hypothetical protein